MNKMKIYMVDDHEFILVMTKQYLESNGITVIGNTTDYNTALAEAHTKNPDVVIVDMNLGGRSGIDLIKELKSKTPEMKILVFSARTSLPAIAAAYRAGAMGYLNKSCEPLELTVAICKIYAGQIYYMQDHAEKILNYHVAGLDPDPCSILSKREYEIFLDIAQNKTHDEISAKYDIAPRSITSRISEIRKKLNNTNEDFSIIANRHGISFIPD
jgi:two-component system invasion response regulator UvrY